MPVIRLLATRFCLIPPSNQFSEKSKSEYTNISSFSAKQTYTSANSSVQKHPEKLKFNTPAL
jgi:hypothetical protein